MEINWENVSEKEDFYISYLLYKEGKSIDLVSKIRNIPKDEASIHIIKAKDGLRKKNTVKKITKNLDYILTLDKEERIEEIELMMEKDLLEVKRELYVRLKREKNIDELMSLIWICGEMKDEKFLNLIHKASFHLNGNIRRMSYSAMKKIGSTRSLEFLHRGITDKKPQVRQYAAKSLELIGDDESLRRLKNLMDRKDEKEYVKRSFSMAIEEIEKRI